VSTILGLKNKAKFFPNSPGVYLFLDKKKGPLYIGRAGSLKRRVASYFLAKRDFRIAEMVSEAASITYQKTSTILEAIILEANLIKKYWPKYNVRDRDDRSFVYLVILKGKYPKPVIVRGRQLQQYGALSREVFGPYQNYRLLNTALGIARKIFPFSTCASDTKPCFYYQIGLCPGVCVGAIGVKEYGRNIKNLALFFRGERKRLLRKLEKENPEKIKALKHVRDVALISADNFRPSIFNKGGVRIEGYDISHLSGQEPVGAMVVFENEARNPSRYRLFKIRGAKTQSDTDMLQEVFARRLKHKEWPYPNIVFVDGGVAQARAGQNILKKYNVSVPVVGLAKTGGHSAAAYQQDKLIILGAKKNAREIIFSSKRLFQQIRNEAHRFAIAFSRKRRRKKNMVAMRAR